MVENDEVSAIPVVDMTREDSVVMTELLHAFRTIGFATLTNHGVDKATIQKAFAASKSFFELSPETKLKYKFQGYESNRGYIPMGCETHDVTAINTPDKKETFDIGNEDENGFENKWPTPELSDSFRSVMLTYFDAFDALNLRIMRLLAMALDLPDQNYFVDRCNGKHENMRLLHYPSIPVANREVMNDAEPIVRGSVHTDFGTITLLTQDHVGGLRAQRLDGKWVNVPPVASSVVVNVGDMLQRWSNDVLRATPHQVVDLPEQTNAESNGLIPERFSIAFFCNANKDVMLECLDQCITDGGPPRYPPIKAHEYLTIRLSQTISPDASN